MESFGTVKEALKKIAGHGVMTAYYCVAASGIILTAICTVMRLTGVVSKNRMAIVVNIAYCIMGVIIYYISARCINYKKCDKLYMMATTSKYIDILDKENYAADVEYSLKNEVILVNKRMIVTRTYIIGRLYNRGNDFVAISASDITNFSYTTHTYRGRHSSTRKGSLDITLKNGKELSLILGVQWEIEKNVDALEEVGIWC